MKFPVDNNLFIYGPFNNAVRIQTFLGMNDKIFGD
jgi:hypothetical protein